jgi:Sec-independent protein secretion pathway component TatC
MSEIMNYTKLRGMRPYVIIINLILAVLSTTPDLISQIAAFEIIVFTKRCREQQEKKAEKG